MKSWRQNDDADWLRGAGAEDGDLEPGDGEVGVLLHLTPPPHAQAVLIM